MGKTTGPAREKKNDEEMSILVTDHYCITLWICLLPLSVCLTEVMHSRFISSFSGNHSVWLSSFGYRCISLDIQELYHLVSLIGFGIGQASWWKLLVSIILDKQDIKLEVTGITGWTLSSFADWNYHCSRNKTHIWRIFNSIAWTSYIGWSWSTNITVWMNNVPEYLISS